jgi:CPA2 family monovalent cation:H+ antiporter-2
VPRILGWVDASRSGEVFLLAILALCIGTAWLTALAGLSLALGAFLGGMVVSDTEYGHRAMSDVLPLRNAFVSIFFISLGMLFDANVVLEQPVLVAALLFGFLGVKAVLATVAALAMRFPSRVAWLAGVGLAQFSEFGFVLAKLGESSQVVSVESMRPLLAAGIVSMFLTPLLVRAAPHITAGERLLAPLERLIGVRSIDDAAEAGETLKGHVVLVGFGLAGRLTAEALAKCGVRYVALELNAETVRVARTRGLPVYYGDATSREALGHAHAAAARALVILINDPKAAERVVATVRHCAPGVPILIRSRYYSERTSLVELGVSDVVADELEGAIEVMARLLRWIEVPRNVIGSCIRDARAETQATERRQTLPRPALGDSRALAELKIENVLVRPDTVAAGASPASLELRTRTGALVVAVRRGENLLDHPDPHVPFEPGDIVYLVGMSEAIRTAIGCLDQPTAEHPHSEDKAG